MKKYRRILIVVTITAMLVSGGLFSGYFLRPAYSQDLGDILLLGGIILVVSTFGGQINNFINDLLGSNEAAAAGATKVVPIFSVGQGAYVGAAQVVGVPANVRRTRGVAAVNITIGNVAGSALIPISTQRPGGGTSISRVSGVGISAVIDFRL
ncbi:MAG: hypothetical protein ACYDCO_07105 [Armatimonadota bacterium]